MGEKEFGIDHDRLKQYSEDIKLVVDKGVQVAVVIRFRC
jgi:uridylate kinase